ncbi:thionin BTH7-like [Lolium rigidum]|uniref:thionin BTH7-like n=1 Tax=Lolium rigidum TaxID=89674 RepID=UPI001F5DC296|nr:thionin BTH7-like [Lolium rigidum]
MASNTDLRSVIICVLLLGLVLEQVQVEGIGKICCKSSRSRMCYRMCRYDRDLPPRCASRCDCKIISGDSCPGDFPALHRHFEYVYNGEEKKNGLELCGAACASFCDKIVVSASVAA